MNIFHIRSYLLRQYTRMRHLPSSLQHHKALSLCGSTSRLIAVTICPSKDLPFSGAPDAFCIDPELYLHVISLLGWTF